MARSINIMVNNPGMAFVTRFPAVFLWGITAFAPLFLSMAARLGYSSMNPPSLAQISGYFYTPAGWAGFVSYSASFIVVLLLPGLFLLDIVFPPGRLSGAVKIPLSFVASIGVLFIPAIFARIFLFSLETFFWISMGVYSLVAAWWVAVRSRQGAPLNFLRNRVGSINLFLLLGVILFVLWFPWEQPIQNFDNWRYLAFIREDVDSPQILDTDPVFGDVGTRYVLRYRYNVWLLLISLLTRSSGVDPIAATTGYLKLVMALMSLIAVYAAARELFKNREWALFTVVMQALYFASDRSTYYSAGTLLNRIAEDKIVVGFLFLPVLYILIIRYWENRDRFKCWLLLTLSILWMVDFNQIGIVLAAVPVLSFSFLHAFLTRERNSWFLLGPIVGSFILALPWPLFLRIATSGIAYTVTEEYSTGLSVDNLVLVFKPNLYILHPDFIAHPLVISSLLLAVPLVVYLRKSISAQLLFSITLSYIALLFIPFITPLLGRAISPAMLWRVGWILPVAFINSYWLYRLAQYFKSRLPDLVSQNWVKKLYLGQAIPALILLPVILVLGSRIERLPDVRWIDGNVPLEIAEFLTGARSGQVLEGKVIAPPEMTLYTAGFWGRMYVLYDRPSAIPYVALAMEDTKTFYDQKTLSSSGIDILKQHQISHIVIPQAHPLAQVFTSLVSFPKLYEDGNYILYRIPADLESDPLFLGDVHVINEEWAEAVADYQNAAGLYPENPHILLGLARAHFGRGDMTNALSYYHHALEISRNDEAIKGRIAKSLNIHPRYVTEYLSQKDHYQSGQRFHWEKSEWIVVNFLDLLGSDAYSTSGPDFIKKSAFVIEETPKGVIFQHPPSTLSFTVSVPPEASLSFSIGMDPKVWKVGSGDGAQFDITIDDGEVRYHPFSKYIDPKNMPAHRRWNNYVMSLAPFEGKVITITLATGCGPNDNCHFDWAAWGEPYILQPVHYNFITELTNAEGDAENASLLRKDEISIHGEYRAVLFQHPHSYVLYPLTVPENAVLYFGLGMDPAVWSEEYGDGVQYSIYARLPDIPSLSYRIFQKYIDPKKNEDDRRWFDCAVDLSKYGGQAIDLIFEASPGLANDSAYDWGGWSMPVLVSGSSVTKAGHARCSGSLPNNSGAK